MTDKGKAWLMALFLGIVLPGLLFTAAEKILMNQNSAETADELSNETLYISNTPEGKEALIPVLMTDGSVVGLPISQYLTGVLLGEMPADFDTEALKAQAVVARTYAFKRNMSSQKHIQGAVCTEASCCQSYISVSDYLAADGTQEAVNKVHDAVNSTKGQVLTYDGALIEATYFSCSGGRTEDAQAVWGADIPYLQAVDSPGEENAAYYKNTVKISAKEFAAALGISAVGSPSGWLGSATYTSGGGVDTMIIAGKTFSGIQLRQMLGLRSTAFTIMPVGDYFVIQTRGFGHRVGMSQYGAEAMAVGGSTYEAILQHYYPGTVLKTDFKN